SDRRFVEGEPLGEVRLDRQLLLELGLQLELLRVVALLAVACRDERPELRVLETVDPVDRLLFLSLEAEGRGEQLGAEARTGELRCDEVRRGDLVLEVRVTHDQPLEAELVRLALDLRARRARYRLSERL